MKGLMVTLLVTASAGIAQAQQYNRNDNVSQLSSRQPNSSQRSTLDPASRTGPTPTATTDRFAQTSGDTGFQAMSGQTFGGPRASANERQASGNSNEFDRSNPRLGDNSPDAGSFAPSGAASPSGNAWDSLRNQATTTSSSNNSPPFTLQVTPSVVENLKRNGYLRANIAQNIQGSVDQVVLYADKARLGEPTGGNVTENHYRLANDFVVIDIDDYSVRHIEKGTLSLKGLGDRLFRGVVLRYTGSDGRNLLTKDIPELSSASGSLIASTNTPQRGGTFASDNFRDTTDRSNTSPRYDSTIDRRSVADAEAGRWQLNRDPTARRRDRIENQQPSQDPIFRTSQRDLAYNGRPSTDLYSDGLDRTGRDRNDSLIDRDRNYVRDSINETRNSDDSAYNRNSISDADLLARRREVNERNRVRTEPYRMQQSSDYEKTLEEENRIYRAKLAIEQRDREWAGKARWVEEQKRLIAERSSRRSLLDAPLAPANSSSNSSYRDEGYDQRIDRLADRSLDPAYNGRQTPTGPIQSTNTSSSPVDQVARMLQEKEDAINAKMLAVDHMLKLKGLEQKLDDRLDSMQRAKLALSQETTPTGRVASYNQQSLIQGSLGANLASPNGAMHDERYHRLANLPTQRSPGGIPLDVNHGKNQLTNYSTAYPNSQQQGTDGRMLRFMWLMLLLSLGANFYLAMLSRSFYTRYDELADELRETFSTAHSH